MDNIKSKTFFRNKREETLLNDLFLKIFEMNPEKRVSIFVLKDHGALKSKMSEE